MPLYDITDDAEADIREIVSYTLENWGGAQTNIYRKAMTTLKKDFCYENGKVQGDNFISGLSNADYYRLKKIEIMNQN